MIRSIIIQIAKMGETPEGSDAAENPIRLPSSVPSIKAILVEASPLGKRAHDGNQKISCPSPLLIAFMRMNNIKSTIRFI